jgi:hypothetical protein
MRSAIFALALFVDTQPTRPDGERIGYAKIKIVLGGLARCLGGERSLRRFHARNLKAGLSWLDIQNRLRTFARFESAEIEKPSERGRHQERRESFHFFFSLGLFQRIERQVCRGQRLGGLLL